MKFETILYCVNDGIATLTLNRPEVSNGFNVQMCEEILSAIEKAADDTTVQILLLTANGSVFSVGGDLVEMQRAVLEDDIRSLEKIAELVNDISYAMKQLGKPVVMSIDGAVAGAAANMMVAADFCIATDRSRFIQAFVGVGLAPDAGGLYLLARSLGATRAAQLAMTGEVLSAEKALDYGLVYKICEVEKLEATTRQLIKKLKRHSMNSYKAIKQLLWEGIFAGWKDYAALELGVQKALAYTEDFKEGVRAHAERRRPKFIGK